MSSRGEVGMATRPRARNRAARLPRWSGPAWGAIGATLLSIAVTGWWLTQDRAVQYGDAAQHLYVTLQVHDLLAGGHVGSVIELPNYYPPATFVLGALAMFLAGVNVAAPILAQNIVYAPLLALGCYQVARLLAGPRAGLLAVVFALGSPLIAEQLHVFMLDVPQAAFVAVSAWLLLASDRFRRVDRAALAGLALGAGIVSKELAPLYLLGLVAALLAREGGWRNWRGLAAFAAVALLVGAPWYLVNLHRLHGLVHAGLAGSTVPPLARPPLLSLGNARWYLWATLDGLLFAPLFAVAAVGVGAALARVARARPPSDLTLEVLAGLVGSWLVLTVMPHHDMRYTMSAIVFLAALGTAWIVRLSSLRQAVAVAALLGAVLAAQLGASFGVGEHASARLLPGNRNATWGEGVPPLHGIVFYSTHNFLVSGPQRDGDLLASFRALHATGARQLAWIDQVQPTSPWFDPIGLLVFARMADLRATLDQGDPARAPRDRATAIRAFALGQDEPCTVLADGSGVWLRMGNPSAPGAQDVCPTRGAPVGAR